MSIDTAVYRNALSLTNQKGSHLAAQALARLVDSIPQPGNAVYMPDGSSVDHVYGAILKNAIVRGTDESARLAADRIALARKIYDMSEIPSNEPKCSSCPPWRMTSAIPSDWAEDERSKAFATIELSSRSIEERYRCKIDDGFRLHMNVLVVHIERPWFDPMLFSLPGWTLGQETSTGAISSGWNESGELKGLLPAYPVAFIVARDVEIIAFSPDTSDHMIHVGSLAFVRGASANTPIRVSGLHLLGFINRIVPLSPLGPSISPVDGSR
jgi:hypothetical protein